MNKNIKRLLFSVTISALFASTSALAYSVTVGGTNVSGNGQKTSVPGAVTTNFNSSFNLPTGYTGGQVVIGSSSGLYASPPNDITKFFNVNPSAGSPATVKLNGNASYFGFYGGSPDTFNSIELFFNKTLLKTFDGTFLAGVSGNPPNGDHSSGAFFNIFAKDYTEYFNTVKFLSSSNSFETDNHAVLLATPLPAAVWLFGSALIGFISLSNRKRV